MSLIKNLAGIWGVIGISSFISLPGFAEVNLQESANKSFSIAQTYPGQSPTNRREPAEGESTTPGNVNTTEDGNSDDPCFQQGTRGDRGILSTDANRRNTSGSSSDRADLDNETLAAERCVDRENENSPTDSTTPGIRNTPGDSTISPGTRNTPGDSTTPGSRNSQ